MGKQSGRLLVMPEPTPVPDGNHQPDCKGTDWDQRIREERARAERLAALHSQTPLYFYVPPQEPDAGPVIAVLVCLLFVAFTVWRLLH
jgi:hypothetical protein